VEPLDTSSEILSWRSVTSDASDRKQQFYQMVHNCLQMYFYDWFVRKKKKKKEVINDVIGIS